MKVEAPAADSGALDAEIRRLTRIILSDIVIYGPEKADAAIREGRFLELYRAQVNEGRKMVRGRFPDKPNSGETFDRLLQELLDNRRRELTDAAVAL